MVVAGGGEGAGVVAIQGVCVQSRAGPHVGAGPGRASDLLRGQGAIGHIGVANLARVIVDIGAVMVVAGGGEGGCVLAVNRVGVESVHGVGAIGDALPGRRFWI